MDAQFPRLVDWLWVRGVEIGGSVLYLYCVTKQETFCASLVHVDAKLDFVVICLTSLFLNIASQIGGGIIHFYRFLWFVLFKKKKKV